MVDNLSSDNGHTALCYREIGLLNIPEISLPTFRLFSIEILRLRLRMTDSKQAKRGNHIAGSPFLTAYLIKCTCYAKLRGLLYPPLGILRILAFFLWYHWYWSAQSAD